MRGIVRDGGLVKAAEEGSVVEVVLEQPDNYQLDGDVVGELRRLVAEIQPRALKVRVPA